MTVNSVFADFFTKRMVLGSIVMLAILFVASSFTERSSHEQRVKEVNLMIRQVGHQLLLQADDPSSRVLPVIEVKEGTFLLRFESEFVFNHDSLMMLSQRLLPEKLFPAGYTVTVYECGKTDIVYGFQINNISPDILACKGRTEPRGCYAIEILIPDFQKTTYDYPIINVVSGGMVVLLGLTLLIGRFGKTLTPASAGNHHVVVKEPLQELPSLGKFLFDVKGQRLLLGSEVITLTDKECKILGLLNNNFGELVGRETLMQNIWINEGVITGRSLDMFISRLRKKLSNDPGLGITNVHGKGYKLEISGVQI